MSYRVLMVETGQTVRYYRLFLRCRRWQKNMEVRQKDFPHGGSFTTVFESVSDFSMTHKFGMRKRRSTEGGTWSFIDTR